MRAPGRVARYRRTASMPAMPQLPDSRSAGPATGPANPWKDE